MKLRALIVDDEQEAANALVLLLTKTCPQIEITGICDSAFTAVKNIKKQEAELLFLDVEMPGGNGLEVLDMIDQLQHYCIFTTAHNEYALQAIKSGARDYLLKPVDPDDLITAVHKAEEHYSTLSRPRSHPRSPNHIPVITTSGILFINKEDVFYIKADGRYSQLFCKNGEQYMVCKNIGEYEQELNNDFFFRVHKSFLINCRHVAKINSENGGFVEMNNNMQIEISKRKKRDFLNFLR